MFGRKDRAGGDGEPRKNPTLSLRRNNRHYALDRSSGGERPSRCRPERLDARSIATESTQPRSDLTAPYPISAGLWQCTRPRWPGLNLSIGFRSLMVRPSSVRTIENSFNFVNFAPKHER